MPNVVSIIPKENNRDGIHIANGTQVLLSDGSKLDGVRKVTLVAEAGDVWKAVIEVFPTNQEQINALLEDIKTTSTDPDLYLAQV